MLAPLLLAAAGTAFTLRGVRHARRQAAEKRTIFAPCLGSFADPRLSFAPDGYPRLAGRLGGHECRLGIIPDTLALRRLPQLWLTIALPSPCPLPSLVVTARPRGDDYVSQAFDYPRQVDVPSWLSRDTMVRTGPAPVDLERLRAPLVALFDDPLAKEISLGRKGCRLVYRLAEGERASHLLLRQCRFSAQTDPALVEGLVARLAAIEAALAAPQAVAA
ncbi:hypothetical protein RHAL1_02583 [Beijerinckiaceae bacterium RH AL1]|nr:hypothetical protein [Beijerinckiaceae bacterium]VVB46992.1 hypothetical protein RHCH11_RHCH11_02528 [Beijerinckiaceae bacterium RH CH11]VVB47075.1 hypothetical protein RHAL8_02524 [Beijerinckiaceae bacterium RH AL8]VVC55661.1 hypothetical protein RHAL1_02583 [Beijerinckiaceae bacterium RH AL1]